eukprot:TRINITY_DN7986_c0_g1_i1.p1 TRINITY_DN7986_c0_g1~~TRINITY_DN7986_c0_g1_i1.p1  ORF type:complete len:277 (-),score=56.75 TRINITY_DN7986_c0_g1_i1:99-929(-)
MNKEQDHHEFISEKYYPKGTAGKDHCWDDIDATQLKLRGATYLKDKVKIQAKRPLLKLLNCDFFLNKDRFDNYSGSEHSYLTQMRKDGDNRFVFCIMMQFPPQHMMTTWVLDVNDVDVEPGRKESREPEPPKDKEEELYQTFARIDRSFATLWRNWLAGNDQYKSDRLKLFPRVVTGGFVMRHALATGKPTILGTKLTCRYHNHINDDKHYFEIDCDVHSSEIAKRLIGLIKGSTKDLSFDCAFLLEGRDQSELPERILAGVNFSKVNTEVARPLK